MSTTPRILLGTLAKACLSPGNIAMQQMMGMPQEVGDVFGINKPSRPRKVLFATQGFLDMLEPDLKAMGIRLMGVAEPNLIRSIERHQSAMMDAERDGDPMINPFSGREGMGHALLAQNRAMFDP